VRRVRAAGGVVVRRSPEGELQVLLVHRPRYGDWTFPKGKLADREDEEEAALREVEEETGLRCRLGPELATTRYRDSGGRPKQVRYYLMTGCTGKFEPDDEVDEVRWADPVVAADLLSYDRDLAVLGSIPPGA
jgi:8-oxo-dGTP pyrophosphatase MutT (NUDIX family)